MRSPSFSGLKITGVSLVIAFALLLAWLVLREGSQGGASSASDPQARESEASAASSQRAASHSSGVAPREASDAVNFQEKWSLGERTHEIERALQAAARGVEKLGEAPEWTDFYASLSEPFFIGELAEACGSKAKPPENCYVSIRTVAVPAGEEDKSVLRFSEVAETEPWTLPCRHYASCIAQGMLGLELPPLPRGSGPEGTVSTWHMEAWTEDRLPFSRAKLERCIARAQEHLDVLHDWEDPEIPEQREYQYEVASARLAWCTSLLEQLETREAGGDEMSPAP